MPVRLLNVAGLRRRGLALVGLTIAWNVIEAVVAIAAGVAAGSIALVGFGFDSTVEVMSSVVVVWQFRGELGRVTTRTANASRSA